MDIQSISGAGQNLYEVSLESSRGRVSSEARPATLQIEGEVQATSCVSEQGSVMTIRGDKARSHLAGPGTPHRVADPGQSLTGASAPKPEGLGGLLWKESQARPLHMPPERGARECTVSSAPPPMLPDCVDSASLGLVHHQFGTERGRCKLTSSLRPYSSLQLLSGHGALGHNTALSDVTLLPSARSWSESGTTVHHPGSEPVYSAVVCDDNYLIHYDVDQRLGENAVINQKLQVDGNYDTESDSNPNEQFIVERRKNRKRRVKVDKDISFTKSEISTSRKNSNDKSGGEELNNDSEYETSSEELADETVQIKSNGKEHIDNNGLPPESAVGAEQNDDVIDSGSRRQSTGLQQYRQVNDRTKEVKASDVESSDDSAVESNHDNARQLRSVVVNPSKPICSSTGGNRGTFGGDPESFDYGASDGPKIKPIMNSRRDDGGPLQRRYWPLSHESGEHGAHRRYTVDVSGASSKYQRDRRSDGDHNGDGLNLPSHKVDHRHVPSRDKSTTSQGCHAKTRRNSSSSSDRLHKHRSLSRRKRREGANDSILHHPIEAGEQHETPNPNLEVSSGNAASYPRQPQSVAFASDRRADRLAGKCRGSTGHGPGGIDVSDMDRRPKRRSDGIVTSVGDAVHASAYEHGNQYQRNGGNQVFSSTDNKEGVHRQQLASSCEGRNVGATVVDDSQRSGLLAYETSVHESLRLLTTCVGELQRLQQEDRCQRQDLVNIVHDLQARTSPVSNAAVTSREPHSRVVAQMPSDSADSEVQPAAKRRRNPSTAVQQEHGMSAENRSSALAGVTRCKRLGLQHNHRRKHKHGESDSDSSTDCDDVEDSKHYQRRKRVSSPLTNSGDYESRHRESQRGKNNDMHSKDVSQRENSTSKRQAGDRQQPRRRGDSSSGERSDDNDRRRSERRHHYSKGQHRVRKRSSSSSSDDRRHKRRSPKRKDWSTTRQKKAMIKPDKYNGSTCLETYLEKFESIAEYNDWDSTDKAAHLKASLIDGAAMLLWQTKNISYTDMVAKLRSRYGSTGQKEKYRIQLRCRKRKVGESAPELAQDVERLTMLAYPEAGEDMKDILSRDAFIECLDNPGLKFKVQEKEPRTLRDAVTCVMKLETLFEAKVQSQKDGPKLRQVRAAQSDTVPEGFKSQPRQQSRSPAVVKRDRGKVDRLQKGEERPKSALPTSAKVSGILAQTGLAAFPSDKDPTKEIEELRQQIAKLTTLVTQATTAQQPIVPVPESLTVMPQHSPWSPLPQYGGPPVNSKMPLPSTSNQPYLDPSSAALPFRNTTERYRNCYNCGEPGHLSRDCQQPRQRKYGSDSSGLQIHYSQNVMYGQQGEVPTYLKVKVGNRPHLCLLDSGSEITLIPSKMVGNRPIESTTRKCLAANGTHIPLRGWATLPGKIGSTSIAIKGLVTDHVEDILLGSDWLQANDVCWNFSKGQVIIDGKIHQLKPRRTNDDWCRRVILMEDVIVPPRTQQNVATKAVFHGLSRQAVEATDVWGTEAAEIRNGLMVARTILPDCVTNLPVNVLNTSDEPIKLKKNLIVSELEPLQPLMVNAAQSSEQAEMTEYEPIIDEMVNRVDESVPEQNKQQLKQLLCKYATVFSRNEWDLGWTDRVVHNIDVGDHKPIRQTLRRYPPAHLEVIDKHLNDMLKQGVIEPASSPWSSNIVLARKKDGTFRCCIDFRRLNDITRKDAYPLPRIDACLDAMTGSSWFTTLDLRCGYHQVMLNPADADKTAFVTRRGMFRFRTMPFGLTNAVATFQRLIDLTLSGLNLDICLAFLDDVIIFSSTLEQHLERLELVLQRLKAFNLKLKPSKCSMMQTEVLFLGHRVSKHGLSTDEQKTQLITDWPTPTNLRQLRGFLGLSGYYRKFVEGYSRIAAPLTQLLKKNQPFVWTESCQQAFDELKMALSSAPVLALPNDDDLFVLDTDAAQYSIGAVLSQVQQGQERVVAYAGRTLSKNELNYCVTRKELLAVVHFVKQFRQYLLGRKFLVRTDHSALTWLKKTREPIGQNARWLEILGEYDFDVQHRAGTRHQNSDALSRHPCLNKPSCTACHSTELNHAVALTAEIPPRQVETDTSQQQADVTNEDEVNNSLSWSREEIVKAQRQDSEIGKIVKLMLKSSEKPPWKEVELQSASTKSLWHEWERLSLRNDVLCRKWTVAKEHTERWQIVLPECYRREFIRLVHTGMNGGHLGRSKTEEQAQRRVYWPGWRDQIALELKCCEECVRYHRGKAPRQTPLQPFGAGEPFEVIAIDITGKHPRSSRGNEYIVTVTDLFSKWSEAYPVRNHTAPVVAKVLLDNFITRWGAPKRLLSDQGKEFESQLFKELCVRFGIEKIRTSPYKPSSNGVAERFHRTLNAMLAKVIQSNQRNWDEMLQPVMAAYRAAKHESTGYSPNRLVLGRENRAPVDLVLGSVTGEENYYYSYDDFVRDQQKRFLEAHALAREHLNVAAERRKAEYDIKIKETKRFSVGQWVWYYYPRRYVNRYPKWCKNYDGPFLITAVIPPSDYVIQKSKRSASQVVHGDKLKLCHGEVPKSWLCEADEQNEDVVEKQSETPVGKRCAEQRPPPSQADEENYCWDSDSKDRMRLGRPKRMPQYLRDYLM